MSYGESYGLDFIASVLVVVALSIVAIISGALSRGYVKNKWKDTIIDRYLNDSDPLIDPWGNEFRLTEIDGKSAIIFCGPDKNLGTEDDNIVVSKK